MRKRFSTYQLVRFSFTFIILSGILVLSLGQLSPYLFLLAFAPVTFSLGFLRALASTILLNQRNMNGGAVASMINFSGTALGALGMLLGTIGWTNYVQGLGWITLLAMAFSIALWYIFNKNKYTLSGM